jgi:hypothetical protein
MYNNITAKFKIEANDDLAVNESKLNESNKNAKVNYKSNILKLNTMEDYKGPEYELLITLKKKK